MRRKHSEGCLSGGDDLEDDACSWPPSSPVVHRTQTWTQVLEDAIWIASAVFFVYLGDLRSNMIHVLWWDDRIKRTPLYLGVVVILLNVGIIIFTVLSTREAPKSYEKPELLPSAATSVALLGFLSFALFSFALWPIWSFLTLPLLFTLYMALLLISPYLPIGPLRPQICGVHTDGPLPLQTQMMQY